MVTVKDIEQNINIFVVPYQACVNNTSLLITRKGGYKLSGAYARTHMHAKTPHILTHAHTNEVWACTNIHIYIHVYTFKHMCLHTHAHVQKHVQTDTHVNSSSLLPTIQYTNTMFGVSITGQYVCLNDSFSFIMLQTNKLPYTKIQQGNMTGASS